MLRASIIGDRDPAETVLLEIAPAEPETTNSASRVDNFANIWDGFLSVGLESVKTTGLSTPSAVKVTVPAGSLSAVLATPA